MDRKLTIIAPLAALFLVGCTSGHVSDAASLHNLRGTKELSEAHLDDAEARFRLALELSPRFAEAHANLGLVLAQRGDLDGAVEELERAVVINPDLAVGHLGLGNVHAAEGRLPQAIHAYERALSIQPEMPEPRRNLIRLLVADARFTEARAHGLRLVQLEPFREDTIATLAYCELRLDRPAAARARIEQARERLGSAPSLDLVLTLVDLSEGHVEAALSGLLALQSDPAVGSAARLRRAAILADLMRTREALEACRVARAAGDNPDAIAEIERLARRPTP